MQHDQLSARVRESAGIDCNWPKRAGANLSLSRRCSSHSLTASGGHPKPCTSHCATQWPQPTAAVADWHVCERVCVCLFFLLSIPSIAARVLILFARLLVRLFVLARSVLLGRHLRASSRLRLVAPNLIKMSERAQPGRETDSNRHHGLECVHDWVEFRQRYRATQPRPWPLFSVLLAPGQHWNVPDGSANSTSSQVSRRTLCTSLSRPGPGRVMFVANASNQ